VPDQSGTYDHAFRALAALVGWRGASEALSIVSLAGWDSQYWDVADKAADIARDPRSGIGALIKLARDHYGWRHPDEERIEASKAKNARRAAPPPPTSPTGEITTTTTATPQLMTATPPSQAQSSSNGNGLNGNGAGPGAAAGMPSTTPPPTPTELPTEAVLKLLRARARALLEQPMPPHERTFNLRALAHENDFTITPQEIQQLLAVARQDLRGKPLPLLTGQRIKVQRRRWLCEGLIPAGRATLLVSVPKVGKTTFLCALIAAWHYGAPDFLGMPFHGPCPPVLLLGPDMTMEDWADLLVPLGLARRIDDDDDILSDEFELELLPPIAVLWHEGSGVVLDEEGLEAIEDKLRQHPGALLIGDSYTALVQHTGLDEWKPEFIGPLMDLKHVCSLYGATSVMIHHSGKEKAAERASSASRGGNALPAAVSQTIAMRWLQGAGAGAVCRDNRVALSTEGRAGKPVEIVIQQEDDRRWTLLGDGASIEAEQTRLRKVDKISKNDRQAAVYTLILSRWTSRGLTTEVADLLEELPDSFTGTDRAREARNTLEQLRLTHQLVEQKNLPTADRGLVATYWPTGVERGDIAGLAAENKSEGVGDGVRSLAQGGTQDASLPSLPSSPAEPSSPLLTRITPLDMAPIPPAKNSPQEGKEPKELSEVPPREGQKNPPDQLAPSVRGEEGSASPPTWLEHALAVRQEFPSATPFSIAVELQAIHGLRLATDTVQAALQAHDAAAAA
jgi:hypothetical protein